MWYRAGQSVSRFPYVNKPSSSKPSAACAQSYLFLCWGWIRTTADLLRSGLLRSVYHGENGIRTLKELSRSYLTVSKDLTRVMNRLKALYRSWSIACAGTSVYSPRHRAEWLDKIKEVGVRRRAEFFYQELDALRALHRVIRRDLVQESRKHSAAKLWLCESETVSEYSVTVERLAQ
jgi:hypothetical protein